MAVHLFGRCADIDALRAGLPEGVAIVEDAACAAGADYKGRPAGGLGDVGAFSFHPRKFITTGEGGMLTTQLADLAATAERLRNHGASISEEQRHLGPKPYLLPQFNLLGFNYRMTDLQGAVGVVQLGKLDCFVNERAAGAAWYRGQLADLAWLRLPEEPLDGQHAWQSFVAYVDVRSAPLARNVLMERLLEHGISTSPGTHAVHQLGYYANRLRLATDDFPAARDCETNTLALPLHNRMEEADYAHIIDVIRSL